MFHSWEKTSLLWGVDLLCLRYKCLKTYKVGNIIVKFSRASVRTMIYGGLRYCPDCGAIALMLLY